MHASTLLPLLEAWLDKMRMSLAEAEGVCVVSGPGTFSAVRSGVLDANIVARWFGIPLVGVRAEDASDACLPLLIKRFAHGTRHLAVSYVAPIYDAEPNITMPRTVASSVKNIDL